MYSKSTLTCKWEVLNILPGPFKFNTGHFYSRWTHTHSHTTFICSIYCPKCFGALGRLIGMSLGFSAGTLSSSRRKTAAQRRRAPYRKGKRRSAWARCQCSPCDRCACRAGTGSGRRTQSPSCRSHTCGQMANIFTCSRLNYKVFFTSAVKRLIVINHIQKKIFCLHNMCVCTVYIY